MTVSQPPPLLTTNHCFASRALLALCATKAIPLDIRVLLARCKECPIGWPWLAGYTPSLSLDVVCTPSRCLHPPLMTLHRFRPPLVICTPSRRLQPPLIVCSPLSLFSPPLRCFHPPFVVCTPLSLFSPPFVIRMPPLPPGPHLTHRQFL